MSKALISISSLATKRLRLIAQGAGGGGVRLSLKTGGCNGFEYDIRPTSESKADDAVHVQDGLKVHICGKSLLYLIGTHIDWKRNIMGETFVFQNPNATSKCGCGTSFSA
jgi:iron-sulfur cluster assembly protein